MLGRGTISTESQQRKRVSGNIRAPSITSNHSPTRSGQHKKALAKGQRPANSNQPRVLVTAPSLNFRPLGQISSSRVICASLPVAFPWIVLLRRHSQAAPHCHPDRLSKLGGEITHRRTITGCDGMLLAEMTFRNSRRMFMRFLPPPPLYRRCVCVSFRGEVCCDWLESGSHGTKCHLELGFVPRQDLPCRSWQEGWLAYRWF
ncbi:hypothetical protein B0T14DRAFT_201583 [Immersiella caudata]|uniref:Uncharacterized protein n=1 Tax=Immersiella caudata TaxID=314043 RepID=A0AA39WPH4_9PEZI|nr:hypothetical protein B0T14DRAFT_201583 [Immersiella caudata]